MSEKTWRIALVVEGPTDKIVIDAVLNAVLDSRRFVLTLLQPEESLPFGPKGTGWGGVYRWCVDAKKESSCVSNYMSFSAFDFLVIHLDADVAEKQYSDVLGSEAPVDWAEDLPCANPCIPPCILPCESVRTTCESLQAVLLSWCGETTVPQRTVICMPAHNMESWVMAALFPNDREMCRKGWECHSDPESRMASQKKGARLSKNSLDYSRNSGNISNNWREVTRLCSQASKFEEDILREIT